jgi:phosphatidate cytidylyltransferase
MRFHRRYFTAVVIIPLVLLATLYLDTRGFTTFIAVVIALGAWEWATLCGYRGTGGKAGYTALVVFLLWVGVALRETPFAGTVIALAVLWWLVAAAIVVTQQRQGALSLGGRLLKTGLGVIILVPAGLSLVVLHSYAPRGEVYAVYLFTLIGLADTAAFFAGRQWGKAKLASVISPGKTWTGLWGALMIGAAAGVVFAWATGMQVSDIIIFSLISCVTVAGSVVGDLVESLVKRLINVKNSGDLLPGHGGVLDRIDSLTAAAPIFLSLFWLSREFA